MSKSYLNLEFLLFIRNRKNQFLLLLVLILGIAYMVVYVPSLKETMQQNKDEVGFYLDSKEEFYDVISKKEDLTRAMSYALMSYEHHRINYEHLLDSNHELYTVTTAEQLEIFIDGLQAGFIPPSQQFLVNSESPLAHSIHVYSLQKLTAQALVEQEKTEFPYFYSLTSLQQLKTGFINGLPFLLFMIIAIYGHDMMVHSYRKPSIVKSIPFSFTKKSFLKSVVLGIASLLTLLLFILFPIVKSAVTNGMGSLSLPVVIFTGEYETITLGQFYLFSSLLLILMVWGLIRLNLLLGTLIRNPYLILILFVSFIASGKILEGISIFPRHYLMYIPSTFFDIGNVVLGEKIFLLHTSLTTSIGIIVWFIFIVVIEVFLYLTGKFKLQRGKV